MVTASNVSGKVYRPCEKRCGSCKACKEFDKVVGEIDLDRLSPYQRQHQADIERRRG